MTSYALLDHAASARSASSTAAAATRRAARDAADAARFYEQAASVSRRAAWLTGKPDLWDARFAYTPAQLEADSRNWERTADVFLRSSFRSTESAVFYLGLAAKYRALRDRSKESI